MPSRLLGNLARGLLFILSAPTGTGKTTLVQLLVRDFPCVVASISCTTRQPRPGEVQGVDYHFLAKQEFIQHIKAGDFLEYVELYGDYYGTSRLWVEEQLANKKHVILVIDTQGAHLLKDKIKAVSIFVEPPSVIELERRLRARRTEHEADIEKRLIWAKKELEAKSNYDYLIVNDDLAQAYHVLRSILIAEEHRMR